MGPLNISGRAPKGGGGSGGHGSSSSHGGSSSSGSSSSSSSSSNSGSSSSSTKGGSSSSSGSSYKGGTAVVYTNGGGGSAGGGSPLPWWAILIIVLGSIFVVMFISGLLYYCLKERRRKAQGKDFRAGHAVWKAFCFASGLWLPIWLFKLLKGKKNAKSVGAYSKIDEGQPNNRSAWPGTTSTVANAPYAQVGPGYKPDAGGDGARYEPMGYSGHRELSHPTHDESTTSSYTQPVITGPIEQTGAIPLPTPSPSPAPSMVSVLTAPPPYTRGPVTGAEVYKPPSQPSYVHTPRPAATYSPASHPLHVGLGDDERS